MVLLRQWRPVDVFFFKELHFELEVFEAQGVSKFGALSTLRVIGEIRMQS